MCWAICSASSIVRFLAVLAGPLTQDSGCDPRMIWRCPLVCGSWSLPQRRFPLGMALDQIGPRRTNRADCWGLGGTGGAALFALAQNATHIHLANDAAGRGLRAGADGVPITSLRAALPRRSLPRWRGGGHWPLGHWANISGRMALGLGIRGLWLAHGAVGHGGDHGLGCHGLCGWSSPTRPAPKRPKAPKPACATLLRIRALWWMMPLLFVNLRASGRAARVVGLVPI